MEIWASAASVASVCNSISRADHAAPGRATPAPTWPRPPVSRVERDVKRGVNLMKICDQTGHRSLEMLRVYSRDAELFAGNAAAGLL